MYNVAAKKATVKNRYGIKLLAVPSSTICVATMPLATSPQNSAVTSAAWIAVRTTRPVVPCSRKAPVVRSWKGRESK